MRPGCRCSAGELGSDMRPGLLSWLMLGAQVWWCWRPKAPPPPRALAWGRGSSPPTGLPADRLRVRAAVEKPCWKAGAASGERGLQSSASTQGAGR